MKTPDFTPPALAALALTLITNGMILWGFDIGAKRESALVATVNTVFVVGFLVHDAIVRHGRSRALTVPTEVTHDVVV